MRPTSVRTVLLQMLLFCCSASGIETVVDTSSGSVQGIITTFQQKNVYEFRMVPYAEPPVGELRFKAPVPKSRETSTIDGTKEDYVLCPQFIGPTELETKIVGLVSGVKSFSENCLFLDVYVPETANSANKLPVMFWIHGGGYINGGGRFSTGLVLASLYDVILVTINYRLGALGFFTTGDSKAEGDLGLQDQILALQWVNSNIEAFGGDTSLITIAGESAGGASVAQLTVAPKAKGLFKRAIIQSGGLDNPWACTMDSKGISMTFAKTMNCSDGSSNDIVQCLRGKTQQELTVRGLFWSPACSGKVLPYTIQQLQTSAKESNVAKTLAGVDVLMGLNAQEGGLVHETTAEAFFPNQTDYAEKFIALLLQVKGLTANESQIVMPSLKFLYSDWTRPNDVNASKEQLIDYAGDIYFNVHAIKYKRLHSSVEADKKGRSYFYQLKRRPSWMKQRVYRTGADHGDDVFFVFGNPLQYPSLSATQEEQTLSRVIMAYWTNFMKTGNPNTPVTSAGTQNLAEWPQFDMDSEAYILLDIPLGKDSVAYRMFPQRTALWNSYVPAELERKRSMTPPERCPDKPVSCGQAILHSANLIALLSGMTLQWLR